MTLATLPIRCAFALTALSLASGVAFAQGTAEQRSACMGDAFKFCSSDIPDVPRIEACLKTNEAKLTPGCRAEFHPTTKRTKLQREHFQ